ncbi:MAG TPA: hypothetical protein VNS32_01665, partial [Flavisolibacter sp.]|nr:hypothetical protein [Flavisolibacter sp.]
EFIIEEAEKSPGSDFRITIQVAEEHSFNVNEIASLIHRHFKSKTETASHQARKTVRLGWKTLFIGFLFLIVMYLLTKIVTGILPENALMISLRELFIILAWVALWRPADLLLYEWRIYKRNAKLFERIAKCKVQVIP